MKETKEKEEAQVLPKDLPVFDPENPPYQVQHLCVYLRELEEPIMTIIGTCGENFRK